MTVPTNWLRRMMALGAVLCALAAVSGVARGETSLQIVATDPGSPAVLGRNQPFNLRIAYTTTEPVTIGERQSFEGRNKSQINGGVARRPAGTGEVLLWFGYYDAQRVDRVTVTAATQSGKIAAEATLSVDLTWTGQPAARPAPAIWVERLHAEDSRRRRAALQAAMNTPQTDLLDVVVMLMGWAVPGYFLLQGWLVWRLHGGWRTAAAAPLWPMGAVLLYTVWAFLDGSNLFPVVLIFTAPIAFVYLLIVAGLRWVIRKPA